MTRPTAVEKCGYAARRDKMIQSPRPNRIMAINSKGSRKIVVEGVKFRWRATGTDYDISICLWPKENEQSRVHGRFGYQQRHVPVGNGYRLCNQLVVTNRLIRRIVLHYGVDALRTGDIQIQAGALDTFIDTHDAIRAEK